MLSAQGDFWQNAPSASTIIAFAIAVVVLYKTIGKDLLSAVGAHKEVASAEKERVKTRDDKIAEIEEKLKTVTEAYKIALLEVDTSRLIRLDHKDRIRQLEHELAVARSLKSADDPVHRTEA